MTKTPESVSFGEPIDSALKLTSGARFYKCALQVNPYEYLSRHGQPDPFGSESSYNEKLLEALVAEGVEAIAITDHYRVRSGEELRAAAVAAGIHVFPGFEAVTKDGVHLLCLFDADKGVDVIERVIGDCGVIDADAISPTGQYDVREFLGKKEWGAIFIAAHVATDGGLLKVLSGQARVQAWRSEDLLACCTPPSLDYVVENLRPILRNKDAAHFRRRPVAILNARDVSGAGDVVKPGAWCWLKMSELSIEGLRQAFVDPASRIRLASESEPAKRSEFVAMAWEGGFLDGAAIHFNENLNVLVGGPGTGKSTVVESLRFVLGLTPVGEEAKIAQAGIVKRVLRNGTKVSLLVASHHPTSSYYVIERTVPNPPTVRDQSGRILELNPLDVIPNVEVFGQHEIAELARSPEKLTRLLDRFLPPDREVEQTKRGLQTQLERSKKRLLEESEEIAEAEEQLARLPALEEALARFEQFGLGSKLEDRKLLVRERQVLKTAETVIDEVSDTVEVEGGAIPLDVSFLSEESLAGLPARALLEELTPVLGKLGREVRKAIRITEEAAKKAQEAHAGIAARWGGRREIVETAYQKTLRELQKEGVDGSEFIEVTENVEALRPMKSKLEGLIRERDKGVESRRDLLVKWEDAKAAEYRALERAAKKVSQKLKDRVRVTVTFAGDREPLLDLVEKLGGRLSEVRKTFRENADLSIPKLHEAWRDGSDALGRYLKVPKSQTDRLVDGGEDLLFDVEAVDLPPTTSIELNVAAVDNPPVWQTLEELSTGQKATAVLLLTLLESDAPLVVDQPEDDLGSRFIADGVVPRMRDEKQRRQFVFTTHNANIPVLGDAELIAGMEASGEGHQGHATIRAETMGAIDSKPVRTLLEETLEGGKDAFETRRLKYGY